jgi:phosphoserine phosphatase
VTERPHILPPPPGGGALRRKDEPGAAFFDLDRTLMAGSSAFQFGRAAYKAGLVSRRRLAADAWENLLFRLRGSTDSGTDALRVRVSELLTGVRVRDLQRLAPDVLAGVLPRLYPRMLAIAYEHQDAGRPIFICTAASQEMAELMAIVLTFDGAVGSVSEVVDGHYTGRGAARSPTARARRRPSASSPSARGSTSRPPMRTRTRSPTCRCCARSAIPWP